MNNLLVNAPATLVENTYPGGTSCEWKYTANGVAQESLFYVQDEISLVARRYNQRAPTLEKGQGQYDQHQAMETDSVQEKTVRKALDHLGEYALVLRVLESYWRYKE